MVKNAGLEELRAQIAEMAKRLERLEHGETVEVAEAPESASARMTEDEMLAVSAAIAAYLGVRAHIRQIRLVSTSAWAQQGRVSIQASHSLMA
jgi:methylmalonyl-CoA carboxyltransferase large subunit